MVQHANAWHAIKCHEMMWYCMAMTWCYVIENLFDMILKRPHACTHALSTVESYFFAAPILFDVRTHMMWFRLFLMPSTNAEYCLLGESWCVYCIYFRAPCIWMKRYVCAMRLDVYSKMFPTDPWNIPQTCRFFYLFGSFGMRGVCFKRTLEPYKFILVLCISFMSIHNIFSFTSTCAYLTIKTCRYIIHH